VGGYAFKLAGGPIAWQAKRQTCVATSSNEAEYIAASETSREAYWIREIMKDLQLFNESPAPSTPIHMDNKDTIDLTTSDVQSKTAATGDPLWPNYIFPARLDCVRSPIKISKNYRLWGRRHFSEILPQNRFSAGSP
jgi:hypothetical protein